MYHDFTYEDVLASSLRAQWQLDEVLRVDEELDFSRDMLPDSLARTAEIALLSAAERRLLNQISANQYLYMFGVVEEFILPFVLDHARPMLSDSDDYRIRALLNFAGEEAKHVQLFRRFHEAFERGFPVRCAMIGPRETLGAKVLAHDPLAVGLAILMIEWMTQDHYLGSIRDDGDIDPLFRRLLKFHWMEEAQHAKLDTLIVDALAEGRSDADIERTLNEFFDICAFLDMCLGNQARLNVATLEQAIGRDIPRRNALINQQHQAARWTYLGSGLTHPNFEATLLNISPDAAQRVRSVVGQVGAQTAHLANLNTLPAM